MVLCSLYFSFFFFFLTRFLFRGRMLVSHVLLYTIFLIWVVLAPLAVVGAVVGGFLTGRGTVYLQAWGYLTLYVSFEVIGTFWISATTM